MHWDESIREISEKIIHMNTNSRNLRSFKLGQIPSVTKNTKISHKRCRYNTSDLKITLFINNN